jgi:hypothetical protein
MEAGAAAVAGAEGAAVAMVVRVFIYPGNAVIVVSSSYCESRFSTVARRQLNLFRVFTIFGATFNKIAPLYPAVESDETLHTS